MIKFIAFQKDGSIETGSCRHVADVYAATGRGKKRQQRLRAKKIVYTKNFAKNSKTLVYSSESRVIVSLIIQRDENVE